MTSSHKRPREELNTTLPELSNAQKYRRVVPKQEMDMPTFSESSTTTAEGFGMHNNLNTQQGFSGPSNFRPTLPSPTPSFPIQTAPPQQQDHVKFETALEFLDQVKSQFSATPGVYKQFLKIMKDFKHHEIDTPGVIRRVSELFHGHDHLILGFNRFLPEGYKITPNDIRKNSAAMSNLSHEGNTNSQSASATAQPSSSSQISSPNRTAPMYERNGPIPTQENINVPETTAQSKVSPNASSESPSTPTQEKKQPELDHARNYVRKIKLRFERQPDIYKSFLRILHTFHEEHHTIKDVYDQVATLFRNHPDLLAEFKQFLPDKSGSLETTSPRSSSLRRRQSSSRRKSTTPVPEFSPKQTPSANDYNFFESAKSQLRNEPFLFNDFIKTLHLFNEGVLSRANLLILIRDLFSEYPELYEEFIQFCDFTDVDLSQEIQRTPSPSPPPVESRCEIDFTTCKKYGPSYRGIPEKYQKPKCSGRTSLCDEVLNDEWVSVPIGSEEFKVSLKSQYEEVLFACEDERHELDMVIELNDSTIKSLTAIAKQIAECSKEDLSNFKIQDGLDVLHLRSIERIYGNKGHLIIQGMSDNPVITIPIVLRRLQQKQEEWKSARSSWNTIWQEVHETNYYRSLDYQSEHFKNREKKLLNPRELLAEVKSNCFVPTSNVTPINTSPTNPTAQSHPTVLSFDMKESSIFADIEELIKFQATQMINMTAEPESLENFINNFIRNFFITATCENTQGLLFGNNSFYVFFRFYQMLYERLLKAKQMAQDSFRKPAPNNTQKMMSHKLVSKPKKGFSNAEEKYSHYLNNMLRPLVEGDLDFAKYEDTCRELFGISSYILFTMDRLLKVLVKQIFSIFLEETSSKLAALMIQYQDVQESIYHTNALSITGEERCFKFIYKLPEGKFTIQVLDSELKPNTTVLESPKEQNSSKPVAEPPRNSVQPEQSETIDVQKHNVFLLRNQAKTAASSLLTKPVVSYNGLECKVCNSTYRLFYVEETEDYFYRVGQLARAGKRNMQKQIDHMHKWIDNRLSLP